MTKKRKTFLLAKLLLETFVLNIIFLVMFGAAQQVVGQITDQTVQPISIRAVTFTTNVLIDAAPFEAP